VRALFLVAALRFMFLAPLTDVVVRVDSADVTAADVASVTITVSDLDGTDGGTQVYASQALPLCAAGQRSACYSLPISVTLAPGSHAPSTKVRVQVDATAPDGSLFSSDAALFTFTPRASQHLDFFLSKSCNGSTCATSNQSCGISGACGVIVAKGGSADLVDLATPPPPTTSVGLVSLQTGSLQSGGGSPFSVLKPDTRPGDLVVVGLSFDTNESALVAPPAWSVMGMRDVASAVVYRFIDGTESNATYSFTTPALSTVSGGTTVGIDFGVLVFRGAVPPIQATRMQLIDASSQVPTTIDFTLDSSGALVPGGEAVALLMNQNGGIVSCARGNGLTDVVLDGMFGVVGASWLMTQPLASIAVECDEDNELAPNDIYSFVLSPAQ